MPKFKNDLQGTTYVNFNKKKLVKYFAVILCHFMNATAKEL